MISKTFGFIGGGRVVKILLKAMSNKNQLPSKIIVTDTNAEVLKALKNEFPGIQITGNNHEAAGCDYVFLSLHPPVMLQTLAEINPYIKPEAVVISLAPKISIAKISAQLDGFNRIVRIIPNAPSYINEGYNPVAYATQLPELEKSELGDIFALWGEYPEVDEYNLEAYAITTAMGPTYLWFQLRQLHELGLSFGLSEREVKTGITAMVKGAVDTLYDSHLSSTEVIDLVPVKPLAEFEKEIAGHFQTSLTALFHKLKN